MKTKIKQILIFSLLFLVAIPSAELSGRKYTDDKYKFEITVPRDWKINTTSRKKHVMLIQGDNITEVGVDVFPLESHQKNAQTVAIDHIIAYDGWQYIAGRNLGWMEKKGATTGFCTMYNKSMLGSHGGKKKIIVQEYYFVKYGRAYIVTLITDRERWYEVKDDLLGALGSFKID